MTDRRLDRSKTAEQVCLELGGLLGTHALLRRARLGQVPGAFKIGRRTYFAPNTSLWLVRDLSAQGGAGLHIRAAKEGSDVDGYLKPS